MLSKNEFSALEFLVVNGAVLVTRIPEENEKDIYGNVIAGIRVYRKLNKRGLVIITDEEPDENGFEWTPQIEITEEGKMAYIGMDEQMKKEMA